MLFALDDVHRQHGPGFQARQHCGECDRLKVTGGLDRLASRLRLVAQSLRNRDQRSIQANKTMVEVDSPCQHGLIDRSGIGASRDAEDAGSDLLSRIVCGPRYD